MLFNFYVLYVYAYSYDRGTTYNVLVGQKKLIAGMDKALEGMCVNERWTIKIPPQLAYGKSGYGKTNLFFQSSRKAPWTLAFLKIMHILLQICQC